MSKPIQGHFTPYNIHDQTLSCEDKCKALVRALFVPEITWEIYSSRPAPVFGGKSAQQLIDEGKCDSVFEALWAVYSGAYL